MSAWFLNVNRNKRSLVLDLKRPEGCEAILALLATADVLVYNVRPAAMRRLGLDYENLRERFPKLIRVGAFGFSQSGPYGSKPAYDDLIQGLIALPALSAAAGDGVPRYLPVTIVDRTVALHVVNVVVAALFERSRSGVGQDIQIPMFETMVQYVLGDHMQGRTFEPPLGGMGYDRLLVKNRRPYETKDGHVCVLVYTDRHWEAFCSLIGKPEMWDEDPRLRTISTRSKAIKDLYGMVAEHMLTKTTAEWIGLLEGADIPANPMHTLESLLSDPHLQETGYFEVVEHPTEGPVLTAAPVGEWSRTPTTVRRLAPRLGEHSAEILREAGYDDDGIRALMDSGATRGPTTLA